VYKIATKGTMIPQVNNSSILKKLLLETVLALA
jgi:hypothetical protein